MHDGFGISATDVLMLFVLLAINRSDQSNVYSLQCFRGLLELSLRALCDLVR